MAGNPDGHHLWQVAQALNRAAAAVSPPAAHLPPLLFFTDPVRTPRPWETADRLPVGAGVVYRSFGRDGALTEALRLRDATRTRGLRLLIGQDEQLATAVGADGLHLPERDRHRAPDLRRRHPEWQLTAALHEGGEDAGTAGLDALVLSPVFRAGGDSAARRPLGIEGLARRVAGLTLPVYGLGGITHENAPDLVGTGLCGIAAIEGVEKAYSRP